MTSEREAYVYIQLPGTSMGGARPKATIEDAQCLWLGKFPATDDRFNLQRFDREYCDTRTDQGYLRFGLVSGLTVLDRGDSLLNRERWAYPLLADDLRRWSDKPEADCAELFRRMVFNAAVTSNDDHPRGNRSAARCSPSFARQLLYLQGVRPGRGHHCSGYPARVFLLRETSG